ncbi:MAG: LamG domain-containing protein [Pseudomonadota bacterium]
MDIQDKIMKQQLSADIHKARGKHHFILAIAICAMLNACSSFTTEKGIKGTPLVGHWQFDESSGTVVRDSSPQKNNGTLVGGPTWEANGQFNGALYFDGKDDYVSLGDDWLNIASELTVSLWVNFEKSSHHYQTLIQRGIHVYPFKVQLAGNHIRTAVRTTQDGTTSQTHYLSSITELAEKRWYHVAMTYQNGLYILYIDGKKETKDVVSGELVVDNHAMNIGAQPHDSSHMQGLLDDVRIYNKALNPRQVQALFKGQAPGTTRPKRPAQ